ncbi:MAG: hypothetical protein C0501_04885 [Isosphaera sp.]|nr:hypothetical protein [Isosphaera sp.]
MPYALTAFFALNPATMELVIFAHLHGYLLYLVLLLGAVGLLLRHLSGPRAGSLASPALWAAWVLTLVSAFTYELGQLFAVLAGLLAAVVAYPRAGLPKAVTVVALFAVVPVAYQAVNAHDLEVHRGRYTPDEAPAAIRERVFTRATVNHSVRFALFTAVHPVCPSVLQLSYVEGRIHQAEVVWDGRARRHCGPAVAASAVVLALAAGCGLAGLRNLVRRGDRLLLLVAGLFAALYGMYAGITVLGRMNLRPDPHPTLVRNTYYAYFGLLFLLVGLYAAWQGLGRGGPGGSARTWLLAGLLALTAVGGERVREVNLDIAVQMTPETRPLRAVQKFLDDHRGEPDLTIAIDYEHSDPVPRMCGRPVTWIVFRRVLTDNPKYGIVIRGTKAVVVSGPGAASPAEAARGN